MHNSSMAFMPWVVREVSAYNQAIFWLREKDVCYIRDFVIFVFVIRVNAYSGKYGIKSVHKQLFCSVNSLCACSL